MAYRPFLIADLQTAKSIGKQPWLSPQDAFETLENIHVNKGVFKKRLGFSPYAQMTYGAVAQTTTSITGIHALLKSGMPSLLIMDTARVNFYDPVDQTMTDVSSDLTTPIDIFSGSASDFFTFLNLKGVGYMVNNVDQIHQWSGRGNAVVPFNIQISSDTKTNHVDTCRFMFVIDDRMVLVDTVEFGEHHSGRLRFSPVGQLDFSASGSGTDDAETQERISAMGMIGKTAYAFFEGPSGGSLWRIRRTGNTDIPLEWERVTKTEGSRSPYSGIEFKDGLVSVGLSNILFYDGFKIQLLDLPAVRDILTEFNDGKIKSVFGFQQRERDEQHLLFTFANAGSANMDRILDYNVIENNWTKHRSNQSFFVNVIGGFNDQAVPAMIDLDKVVTFDGDIVGNMTVDSRAVLPLEGNASGLGTPTPITLVGARNSRVYKWNDGEFDGTNDANGTIAMNGESSRWNPFTRNGRKVACEKIGFYVTNDSSASFLASVFKSTRGTAYKTKTISCASPDTTKDKFWVWIFCDGEIGDFHRLGITHDERGNTPEIHAFMPYFEAAGRLDL